MPSTPPPGAAETVQTPPASPVESTSQSTPTPAPSAAETAQTPAPISEGAAAGASAIPSAAAPPAASSTPQVPAWLGQLRGQGVDLPADNEQAALQAIAQSYRDAQQFKQISPYVQTYMQHAAEFNNYLRSKAQQQPPAQAQPDKPWYSQYWNPPEFNPSWQNQLTRDDKGNVVLQPGAPPDVLPKYLAYQQFRQEQAEKLMSNPYEFFAPAIRQLARQEAESIAKQQLGQHQEQLSSHNFVQANQSWLYELDNSGQRKVSEVFNPHTGQYQRMPVLSEMGRKFGDYVAAEAERQKRRGYEDVEEQKTYAMAQVQRDFAFQQLSRLQGGQQTPAPAAPSAQTPPPPPQNPREAANEAFLRQNNAAPAPQPVRGNVNPNPTPVSRLNFQDELKDAFKRNGITDEVINGR